jgi:hypothetical protein
MKLPVLLALALCAGCSKSKNAEPERKPVTEPQVRRKLDALQFTLPPGWTQTLDDIWIFHSPKTAERPDTVVRIDHAPYAMPRNAKDYVQRRVDHYWDQGTTAEVVSQEDRPGGFAATVRVAPAIDPKHPKLEYYAIWTVGDELLRCECEWVPDEALRDQIAALCKSARWGQ